LRQPCKNGWISFTKYKAFVLALAGENFNIMLAP